MDISSFGNENVTPTPNTEPPTPNSNTNPSPTPNTSFRTKTDPAWAYVAYKKEGTENVCTCLFYANSFRGGGIHRMKQHLTGVIGHIASCKKVPHDVRHRIAESLKESSKKKSIEVEDFKDDDVEEANVDTPISESAAKKRKAPETMDNYFAPRTTPDAQPSIKSALATKEAQHNVKMNGL